MTADGSPLPSVLFTCTAENRRGFCNEVVNLALSIREFGGALASSAIVANFVEGADSEYVDELEALDVSVRVVERFDPRSPPLNKLRMLDVGARDDFDVLVALDTDAVVARDLAPLVEGSRIGVAHDLASAMAPAEWDAVFAGLGVAQPTERIEMVADGSFTVPYYNTGVMFIPRVLCAPLFTQWSRRASDVLDVIERDPAISDAMAWFTDQVSFATLAAENAFPLELLSTTVHFQSEREYPDRLVPLERPFVVHYMRQISQDGFLEESKFPVANLVHEDMNRARADHTGVEYRSLSSQPLSDRVVRQLSRSAWFNSPLVRRARSTELLGPVRRAYKSLQRPRRGA